MGIRGATTTLTYPPAIAAYPCYHHHIPLTLTGRVVFLHPQNSIRHNLSLHSRFEKIQNEGTGKSSWWQINHNASRTTGKSRRRAVSMETPKFEKRRGRVKKVVEAIRNGLQPDNTPSPSSSVSENSDMIPVSPLRGFQFRSVSTIVCHVNHIRTNFRDVGIFVLCNIFVVLLFFYI